jgi:hypothetical protein
MKCSVPGSPSSVALPKFNACRETALNSLIASSVRSLVCRLKSTEILCGRFMKCSVPGSPSAL